MKMNSETTTPPHYRWFIIVASFIVMMVISIYQYSWFLFAYTIQNQLHWDLAQVGLTFTIFAYAATFVQPFSGYIADSYGPKIVSILASILVGIGFILASFASSPLELYLYYGLGGLGVGVLYGVSTACAVKWFPDKRGFATGLVVFGFGAGTAIFNLFIQSLLVTRGLQTTFLSLGVFILVLLIPLSLLYKYPDGDWVSSFGPLKKKTGIPVDRKPLEMLSTHQWFLIYFSFTITVSIVLMFGAQMKMLAREFNIPAHYFKALLIIFPLGNGLSRVLAGSISDRVGREKTMVIFYALLGISILCFSFLGHIPILFIIIVFIAALLGGAPFALYPATIGDYYGTKYSTTNYGITYTAKAWAGLISGWLSGFLVMQFGSYRIPLIVVAVGSLIAAVISNPKVMKAPARPEGNSKEFERKIRPQ
ncbi:MAG: OFA family MFS transporter [Deltaproteobacteria bacterium]|nr:OFA family MFS transporter [Deltaproteobacteria bacterium]